MKVFKRKPAVIILSLLILIILLAAAAYITVIYTESTLLFNDGLYIEAAEKFSTLKPIAVSKSSTLYNIAAEEMINEGHYKEAAETYSVIDEPEKAAVCYKKYGAELLNEGHFNEAETLYNYIDDSEGLKQCRYEKAVTLLQEGNCLEAYRLFESCGMYRNSRTFADSALDKYFQQGELEFARLNYSNAEKIFKELGTYKNADRLLKYVDFRKNYKAPEKPMCANMQLLNEFKVGQLFYKPGFYIYKPYHCDEYTKSSVYFAGGTGGPILKHETIMKYLRNFQPNAVMLFYIGSGFNDIPAICEQSFDIMSELAYENDIVIHDLIITGSSLGCATALKACPYYFDNFNISPIAMCALDNGKEWDTGKNLNYEEMLSLSDAGTVCFMYEQSTDLKFPPVEALVENECKVVMVKCKNYGHDAISVYGFREGCFTSMWENTFNRDEYTLKYYFNDFKVFPKYAPVLN